jgi:hypothetical protein
MLKVLPENSVKKRMDALKFDPLILDEPDCMIGLDNSVYKDRRVPQKILDGEVSEEEEEEEEVEEKPWFESDESEEAEEKGEEEKEQEEAMKARMQKMFQDGTDKKAEEQAGKAAAFVNLE